MRVFWAWWTLIGVGLYGCSSDATQTPVGGCLSNRDCGADQVCVSGECRMSLKSGCGRDDECNFGEICDPNTKSCIVATSCANDQACPTDQYCNTLTGVCIPRTPPPDPDGGVGPQPDSGAPEPGDECRGDSECAPPATICKGNICVLGCAQPGGGSCPSGEVCNSNTGQCVSLQGPCSSDANCSPPMTVCESNQCIPGCAQTGGLQCSGGMICNPNSGRCGANTGPICGSDLECNPPSTVCNLFSGACDPGCGASGCTAPATCNTATGHCSTTMTCNPDRFEPNNTRAQAATINGGAQSGLTTCAGDEDWFSLPLAAGDDLTVTITFVHGEGNLDLELYDAGGSVVATSRTTSGTETFTYRATAAGTYSVRVQLVQDLGPNPGNQYTLQIQASAAPCAADGFEENDEYGDAAFISDGTQNGLNVCTGDDDFYRLLVSGGETVTAEVTFNPAEGDIDLALLGLFGIPLDRSSTSNGTERVSYTFQNGGFAAVQVTLYSDTGSTLGTPYTLNVTVTSGGSNPPPSCTADSLEPNDAAGSASPISAGSTPNLTSCAGNDDYYRLALTAGQNVTITVQFTDAEGDIDAEVRDPAGTVVASGTTNTDNETLSFTAGAAGNYVLRITLYGDAGSSPGNSYNLMTAIGGGGGTCPSDLYEPNDNTNTSPYLLPGTYSALTACSGSDDYYDIDLPGGVPATVRVNFTHAEGDIDLTLLDAAGTVVGTSAGTTNGESITFTPPSDGAYFVRAYLYRDLGTMPGNTYDLIIP